MWFISDLRRVRRCLSLNYWPDRRFRNRRSRQAPRPVYSELSPSVRSIHFTRALRLNVPVGTRATTSTASTDNALAVSRCKASDRPTPKSLLPTHSVTQKVVSCCCLSPFRAPTSSRSCSHRTYNSLTMRTKLTRLSAHLWRGQRWRVDAYQRRVETEERSAASRREEKDTWRNGMMVDLMTEMVRVIR